MSDCLFCAIADGSIPSSSVYETNDTFAFLDINPLQHGHTLVIPKAHAAKLSDLDADSAASVMHAVQTLTPVVCEAAGAADATIAVNDGPDAGQEVPHVHVHIVPRRPGDGGGPVHALFPERPTPDADAINAFSATVKANLGGA